MQVVDLPTSRPQPHVTWQQAPEKPRPGSLSHHHSAGRWAEQDAGTSLGSGSTSAQPPANQLWKSSFCTGAGLLLASEARAPWQHPGIKQGVRVSLSGDGEDKGGPLGKPKENTGLALNASYCYFICQWEGNVSGHQPRCTRWAQEQTFNAGLLEQEARPMSAPTRAQGQLRYSLGFQALLTTTWRKTYASKNLFLSYPLPIDRNIRGYYYQSRKHNLSLKEWLIICLFFLSWEFL